MFGDGYVLPLDQTFADIQRSLGADSVHLASEEDFGSIASSNKRSCEQSLSGPGLSEGELSPSKRRKGSIVKAQSPTLISDEEFAALDVAQFQAAPPDSAYGSAHVTPQSLDCSPPSELRGTLNFEMPLFTFASLYDSDWEEPFD